MRNQYFSTKPNLGRDDEVDLVGLHLSSPCSGCCDKISSTRWLISHRIVFLVIWRWKCQAEGSFSVWWDPASGSRCLISVSHVAKGWGALQVNSPRVLMSLMRSLPTGPSGPSPHQGPPRRMLRFQQMNFVEFNESNVVFNAVVTFIYNISIKEPIWKVHLIITVRIWL